MLACVADAGTIESLLPTFRPLQDPPATQASNMLPIRIVITANSQFLYSHLNCVNIFQSVPITTFSEREKERERETERQRDRETERQRDRERERETETETETETERETERQRGRDTETQRDRDRERDF